MPSVWPEPFGQVAVEGLAAGTPMVVSRTGGLTDVVRDEVDGLTVPPNDPLALRAALLRLLGDANLRARLAAAGPPRSRAFTIGAVLPSLLGVYEQARRAAPQHG